MKKFALILLVLLPLFWASFASPQPARAATITVGTLTDKADGVGACSLREAIQNANDDAATFANCTAGTGADIIDFSVSGTINFTLGSSIFVTDADGLVIDGGGNIGLDGGGSPSGTRLLDVTGVLTLDNITIQNGYNSGAGGAISTNFTSDLTITNSYFTNNVADGNGGALLVGGALTITDSVFETNSAGGDGGAIHFSASSSMNITNVAFIGNSAGNNSGNIDGSGGAIWHNGAVAGPSSITGSYFLSNQVLNAESADGGGAIYHGTAGILAITASAFFGNDASGDDARGGAIYNNSGDDFAMTINYSHFGELLGVGVPPIPPIIIPGASFNIVAAIGANGAGNTVSGTSTNTAGGGAIYNNGYLLMNGVSLIANSSSNHGGAFMNTRTTPDPFPQPLGQQVIISNSTFSLNSATNNGGAIFHGNSFIPNDNLMEIRNVTIADNNAALGDGIFNLGDGESSGFSNFDDFYLVNTIIANDSCDGGSLGAINTSGTGNNVVFGGSCTILLQDGGSTPASTITADPVLSAPELAFNLANIFTVVRSLGPSSSASGTGDNGVCTSFPVLSLDQRNLPLGFRPQGAPACDIGAYESDQVALPEINVRDGANTVDILDGATPATLANGTDFGTTPVGTPLPQNFIIQNQGGSDLSVTAIVPPAGFTVGAFSSTITAGNQITVQVTCTAATAGIYSGDLIIQNNDSDENPYNFAITCEVEGPEIEVRDGATNTLVIVDGDTTPAVADGTDFGNTPQGTPITQDFRINNLGNLDLTITLVSVSGDFSIFTPPASPIGAGNDELFTVQCDATTVGANTGTVTITNNDNDEAIYTFDVICNVTATGPQIEVFGNSNPINDGGGNSPALINDTDFGALAVGNITTNTRTYTIENNGTAALNISGTVVGGTGFSLFTAPPASIPAGGDATFVVTCDTSAPASHIGSVTITNNTTAPTDSYTFNLACPVIAPTILVSKVENTDPVNAGSPIIYTVSIQNTSVPAVDATSVVLTEVLPLGFTANTVTPSQGTCPATPLTGTFNCNIGTIGAGNTVTVAITGTYDPSTPNNSSRTNEAYVNYDGFTTGSAGTDADGDDERAIEETTVNVSADVGVSKTVNNPTPVEGGTIIYTIEVENFGPSTATGVVLSDTLPTGVTFVSLTGACGFINPTMTCNIGTMLPGDVFTATITVTVDAGASALAPITNTANISSTSLDTNGGNDSDDVDINPTAAAPDISILGNATVIAPGDATPDLADHTQFVTTVVNVAVLRTFTIENNGTAVLNISLSTISNAPNPFLFQTAPPATVAIGGSETFTVQCLSATDGSFMETVTIQSNDPDTPVYSFNVGCQVDPVNPDISILGNATVITPGDATPDLADHTQFVTTVVNVAVLRTFTIENNGTAVLNISLSTISNAPNPFLFQTAPPATVAIGGSETFTVQCLSATDGTFMETVSITSDDPDTPVYSFNVGCQVDPVNPDISILGNATVITPGDATPDLADHTQFVTTVVNVGVLRTFTIENNGTAVLNISLSTISNAPNPFLFQTAPPATVAIGGSETFTVQCLSATDGTFMETVSITSDDPDTPVYSFNVGCTVNDEPEIEVYGNSVLIVNGDNTPSLTDDTDFGATLFGTPITRQFIIQNIGSQALTITGAVTVSNPTNFSVTLQPAATIPPPLVGNDTPFEVTCTAANLGTHTATVTIPNDDSDENPFTFDVSCTVNSPSPIIEVRGLGNVIVDGVIAPNLTDGTLFPTTSPGVPVSRTFEIRNTGTGNLTVSISGTPLPVPFTLTTAPTSPVVNGTPTTFTIECDPPANGNYTLTVTIDNNDTTTPGANPFTFGIECVATTAGAPEINVRGNGVTITSGDVTPDLADHTDFGSTSVGIPITRTFTIENTGLGDLTLGLITVPAGFTITGMPTSPVTAGGNTTLGITCDATAQSTYSGTVSIVNDDSDENPYTFAIRCVVNPAGTNADLSLSKIVSDTTPQFGDIITYTVTVNNVGPGATTGVQVVDTFPTSVTFLSFTPPSQGTVTVDGSNLFLTWDIGTMANPANVTLTYTVQVNPTVGTTNNYAEITASTAPDPNSTPGNGIPPTPIEDDEAAIAFLFDPPFGSKAFVYDGVSVVTWTVIWVNPSTQPILVEMSDPLLGGTTFVSGSLTCTALGASITTTCLHNAVTNTIEFTGTIAPNPGATLADVNTASNRLIITYSVVVPDGVDSVANTASLTDLDNDTTVTATETFTRTGTQPTPPPTGGTPPLTAEEINAKVTALPATGETPLWSDILRIGLMTGVALGGAGALWMLRRRRANA